MRVELVLNVERGRGEPGDWNVIPGYQDAFPWITKAKANEPLDTLTPPSESYDGEEVVVLIGQSPQGNITHLLPVHRLGNGKFWNLGDAEDMPADSFEGRFAGLLPPKPADEKTRQMGKMLLQAMGVKVMPWKGR